jgi:hypothetical protein
MDTGRNSMGEREFHKGDLVRHFKREMVDPKSTEYLYRIVGTAVHSENREKYMVYQALYGDEGLYIRPYDMFMSEVDHAKYPEIRQQWRFDWVTEKDLEILWKMEKGNAEVTKAQ